MANNEKTTATATTEVLVVSCSRTPIGKFNGALSQLPAHKLGAQCLRETLHRANNFSPAAVDEVIIGQVLTSGCGQNPARQSARLAGLPDSVPAYTVNMMCGSGMRAVVCAVQAIVSGASQCVLAAGQESMTNSPHLVQLREAAGGKFGDRTMRDSLLVDGLVDAFSGQHMGITAENVAERYGVSRDQQDAFASQSQQRAQLAQESQLFAEELLNVVADDAAGSVLLAAGEFPRHNTTVEKLAKLRPAFSKSLNASVTAGNASGINDGAASLLLMSAQAAARHQLKPLCSIVSSAQVGIDPNYMGMGPVQAIGQALAKAGWPIESVDLFEINEAFASQSVAVCKELGIDLAKVNICGGAIALGHPIGCSAARIIVTLIHQLIRLGLSRGCAAACIGGGMGIAVCVQRS